MKPAIEIGDFQGLDLRVGTVSGIPQALEGTDLSALTVQLDEPVKVLSPRSDATPLAVGDQVVVAVELTPLQALGRSFTAYLVQGPLAVRIPDGSRLS